MSVPRRGMARFNTTSPLGQIMDERALTVKAVSHGTNINERTLSNLLARRVLMSANNSRRLSEFLNIDPAILRNYRHASLDPEGVEPALPEPEAAPVEVLLEAVRKQRPDWYASDGRLTFGERVHHGCDTDAESPEPGESI